MVQVWFMLCSRMCWHCGGIVWCVAVSVEHLICYFHKHGVHRQSWSLYHKTSQNQITAPCLARSQKPVELLFQSAFLLKPAIKVISAAWEHRRKIKLWCPIGVHKHGDRVAWIGGQKVCGETHKPVHFSRGYDTSRGQVEVQDQTFIAGSPEPVAKAFKGRIQERKQPGLDQTIKFWRFGAHDDQVIIHKGAHHVPAACVKVLKGKINCKMLNVHKVMSKS